MGVAGGSLSVSDLVMVSVHRPLVYWRVVNGVVVVVVVVVAKVAPTRGVQREDPDKDCPAKADTRPADEEEEAAKMQRKYRKWEDGTLE